MAAAAPASSDPQEVQAKAKAEAAEASIRSLVPVEVENVSLELLR